MARNVAKRGTGSWKVVAIALATVVAAALAICAMGATSNQEALAKTSLTSGTRSTAQVNRTIGSAWLIFMDSGSTVLKIRPKNADTEGHLDTARTTKSDWDAVWRESWQSTSDSIRERVTKVVFETNPNGVKMNFDKEAVAYMFAGFTNLEEVDFTNFGSTEGCVNFSHMFDGCSSLKTLTGFDKFDVSKAEYLGGMFKDCTALEELDVSHFGKLDNIVTMGDFVNGCTSLKTLTLDNLDNSHIGPTNNRHHISEGDEVTQKTGAAEYTRELGIHTCTALETLSAKNSNVWMCKNNRGIPGSEYYLAANDSDVYFFTDKAMTFDSDTGKTGIVIASDRDYIDLITDRDATNHPTVNPAIGMPDANKNINIVNGDLNTLGAGHLAPGVYHIGKEARTDPAGPLMETSYYRIAYIGEVPYKVEGIDADDPDLLITRTENFTYVDTKNKEWPANGNYVIDRTDNPIKITYENAAIDANGKLHDVVITIKKVTFKDLEKIPTESSKRGSHDGNRYAPDSRVYYRTILQATRGDGVTFRNYVRVGNPAEPSAGNQVLSGGAGTDIDFEVSIDKANKDTSFIFRGEDLDVPYSQKWVYPVADDPCYDNLPIANVTHGVGGEGFVLGKGNDLDTVSFSEHTGLALVNGNTVISTGSDPAKSWSEFTVKGDAQGSSYTWTTGIACTTYVLRNTPENDVGEIELQPAAIKALQNATLSEGQFEFVLDKVSVSPEGAPEPVDVAFPQETTNDADGTAAFEKLKFANIGENELIYDSEAVPFYPGTLPEGNEHGEGSHNTFTYTYSVREKTPPEVPAQGRIKFDTATHQLQIKISTPENDEELRRGIKAEIYVDGTLVKTLWHSKEYVIVSGDRQVLDGSKWYDENGNEIADPNPMRLEALTFTNTNEPLTETAKKKRTISYIYEETGEPVVDDKGNPIVVEQERTFTREGYEDPKTGEVTWNDWTPQELPAVDSPEVKEYVPDIATVPAESGTPDNWPKDVVVKYKKVKEVTETVTKTRKITYVYADTGEPVLDDKGNPIVVEQTLTFTRSGAENPYTGEITWSDWTPQKLPAVDSPEIKGYTPDIETVSAESATPDNWPADVEVKYSKESAKPTWVDGDTYRTKDVVGKVQTGILTYRSGGSPIVQARLIDPQTGSETEALEVDVYQDGKKVGTYKLDPTPIENDDGTISYKITFTPEGDYVGTPPSITLRVYDEAGNYADGIYQPEVVDEDTPTPTPTPTPGSPSSPAASTSRSNAPKTGDTVPVEPFVVSAILGAGMVLYALNRRNDDDACSHGRHVRR